MTTKTKRSPEVEYTHAGNVATKLYRRAAGNFCLCVETEPARIEVHFADDRNSLEAIRDRLLAGHPGPHPHKVIRTPRVSGSDALLVPDKAAAAHNRAVGPRLTPEQETYWRGQADKLADWRYGDPVPDGLDINQTALNPVEIIPARPKTNYAESDLDFTPNI